MKRDDLVISIRQAYLKVADRMSIEKFSDEYAERFNVPKEFIIDVLSIFKSQRRSKGENRLFQILRAIFPEYKIEEQYSVDNYKFDFYIPKLRLAIEYDGIQHFQSWGLDGNSFNSIYKFEDRYARDRHKEQLCNTLNIYLIRIPYTEELTVNNIRRIIHENINQIIHNLFKSTENVGNEREDKQLTAKREKANNKKKRSSVIKANKRTN